MELNKLIENLWLYLFTKSYNSSLILILIHNRIDHPQDCGFRLKERMYMNRYVWELLITLKDGKYKKK